jgi:3-phosphoglycerate kinase
MFTKKTVRDMDLGGKKVLLRVDYNILDNSGHITEEFRIQATIPTINYLLEQNCRIIILTCAGRPGGKVVPELSMRPIAKRLGEIMGREIKFAAESIGPEVERAAGELQPGEILMLENVRFHPEEEANDAAFSQQLASVAEVFVEDGFGQAHRAYASVVGVAKCLPSVAGLLLEKEVDTITQAMSRPERPLMAVVGGAKISDKIDVLHKFVEIADVVAVVGAMANTFLLAEGYGVGKSLAEPDAVGTAKEIIEKARRKAAEQPFTFLLPVDVVASAKRDPSLPTRIVDLASHTIADIESYPKKPSGKSYQLDGDEMILDIGPVSAATIYGALKLTKTALWNGTAGIAEDKGLSGAADPYAHGTKLIVDGLIGASREAKYLPFTVVGGGDTAAYIESQGLLDDFNHVSTGGGASLELMSGRSLPGVDVLLDKDA